MNVLFEYLCSRLIELYGIDGKDLLGRNRSEFYTQPRAILATLLSEYGVNKKYFVVMMGYERSTFYNTLSVHYQFYKTVKFYRDVYDLLRRELLDSEYLQAKDFVVPEVSISDLSGIIYFSYPLDLFCVSTARLWREDISMNRSVKILDGISAYKPNGCIFEYSRMVASSISESTKLCLVNYKDNSYICNAEIKLAKNFGLDICRVQIDD